MKVFILFTLFLSIQVQAGMVSNMPSTFLEIAIPNAHLVNENVIRGMAPRNQEDIEALVNLGVEKFLAFKIDTNGDVADEIEILKSLGVEEKNIKQLDFPWKDITDYKAVCEMTVEALNMIRNADENNQKIYFHCTVGEDRTGYLAGLYRLYSGDKASRKEIFQSELCDKGYEAGNPKKHFSVAKKVKESLTPAFIGMADLIETNGKKKKLTKAQCKNFAAAPVNFKEYSCKKSNLL